MITNYETNSNFIILNLVCTGRVHILLNDKTLLDLMLFISYTQNDLLD